MEGIGVIAFTLVWSAWAGHLASGGGARPCCGVGELVRRGGACGVAGATRIDQNCSAGYMVLRDIVLDGDKLYTMDAPEFVFAEDPNEYCVGEMLRNESAPTSGRQRVAVVCFTASGAGSSDVETSGVLTLVSVVFLLATLAVYAYLPQLRDLQGKCYVCVCGSMTLGFLSLGALQLSPGFRGVACAFTGFTIYFWMMATFFWMNVVCLNMFFTVMEAARSQRSRHQFFLYSCYAWGCPLLLLIVSLTTNFVDGDHYKPGIDNEQCWFHGRTETWLFFYGPVAALLSGNVVLFALSSLALWRTQARKYEPSKLGVLKHRFLLCLKLFLVMGISWVFEIASFAHGESHIVWKIMDTFNCLQGVIIFVLLVVLRRRAVLGLSRAGCAGDGWGGRVVAALADRLSPHDPDDEANLPVMDDAPELSPDCAPGLARRP